MTNELEFPEVPFAPPGNIDELLQLLVDRANQGPSIDIEAVCRQYPQWADELRTMLPALLLFDHSRKFVNVESPARFDSEHGRQLGNYRIGRVIGRGGMGVVYEATQSPLGRRVAIKLLKDVEPAPLARQRFEQEFRVAASLHHTNIVPVFDAGEDNGQLYFAMQFIDGVGVSQWIQTGPTKPCRETTAALDDSTSPLDLSNGRPPLNHSSERVISAATRPKHEEFIHRVVLLGIQVAGALQFSHARGIIHRDIKPANILIDADDNAWVTDFGLAKPVDGDNLTESGDIAGTIRYLAPERLQGKCDGRSDVYALGLVLLELISERPAWDGVKGPALVKQLTGGETCPIPADVNIPTDLRLIIQKTVQPHPEMRYQTARELSDDLTCFIESRPISARRFSRLRSGVLWARRNPNVAALWAASILTLVAGTVTATVLAINWQTAATVATQREQEARTARDRATESLQLTRDSVIHMTSVIADRFYSRQTPLTDLDRQNLNQILILYERLGALESTTSPANASMARGLRVVSGIRYMLGEIKQAKQELIESNHTYRSLVREFPQATEYRLELAEGLQQLGIYESENHEIDRGIELFLAAKDEFIALPKSPEFQVARDDGLQAVLSNIGNCHSMARRWDEAAVHFAQAIELQRSLVAGSPGEFQHRSNLANSLSNSVLCLTKIGHFAEAESAAKEATALQLSIAEHDNSPESWFAVSVSWVVNGKARIQTGHTAEAPTCFEEAEAIAKRLASDYPTVPRYRYHWSAILGELADMQAEAGRYDEAVAIRIQEVDLRRRLANEVPDRLDYRGGLAESLDYLAGMYCVDQPEKAVDCWQESIESFDDVIRINPDLQWAHEERNNATVRMAECYLQQLHHPDIALDLLVQAEANWRLLAQRFPEDSRYLVWQSGTAQGIGLILLEQGKRPEALARLRVALAVAESITPGQEYYATALENIASIKAAIASVNME